MRDRLYIYRRRSNKIEAVIGMNIILSQSLPRRFSFARGLAHGQGGGGGEVMEGGVGAHVSNKHKTKK